MGYDRALFGLPAVRCRALSQCLGKLHALIHLELSMNLLNDAQVDMLAEGLNRTTAISSLVLHSNKVDPDCAYEVHGVKSCQVEIIWQLMVAKLLVQKHFKSRCCTLHGRGFTWGAVW